MGGKSCKCARVTQMAQPSDVVTVDAATVRMKALLEEQKDTPGRSHRARKLVLLG